MHSKLRSILIKVLLYSNRCENSCVNKPDLLRDAALHNESLEYFLNYNRSKMRCTGKMAPPDENFVNAHSQHRQNFSSGPGTSNF